MENIITRKGNLRERVRELYKDFDEEEAIKLKSFFAKADAIQGKMQKLTKELYELEIDTELEIKNSIRDKKILEKVQDNS